MYLKVRTYTAFNFNIFQIINIGNNVNNVKLDIIFKVTEEIGSARDRSSSEGVDPNFKGRRQARFSFSGPNLAKLNPNCFMNYL